MAWMLLVENEDKKVGTLGFTVDYVKYNPETRQIDARVSNIHYIGRKERTWWFDYWVLYVDNSRAAEKFSMPYTLKAEWIGKNIELVARFKRSDGEADGVTVYSGNLGEYVKPCTAEDFKGTGDNVVYTRDNSETIRWFEDTYNRKGVTLVVDYTTVLDFKYYGESKPPERNKELQIEDWRNGYMWGRFYVAPPPPYCTPTGWYWVKYKVKSFYEGEPTEKVVIKSLGYEQARDIVMIKAEVECYGNKEKYISPYFEMAEPNYHNYGQCAVFSDKGYLNWVGAQVQREFLSADFKGTVYAKYFIKDFPTGYYRVEPKYGFGFGVKKGDISLGVKYATAVIENPFEKPSPPPTPPEPTPTEGEDWVKYALIGLLGYLALKGGK